jgi:coatomer subunit beta'
MPLRFDVTKALSARSDRVKSVDVHPTEPWLLAALFSGNCFVWSHTTAQLVKTFEVSELPVRCAKFVPRKQWVVAGSDDMLISVFSYDSMEKVRSFEAHTDYIRAIAVHPTQPFCLTSSDDMTIKLVRFVFVLPRFCCHCHSGYLSDSGRFLFSSSFGDPIFFRSAVGLGEGLGEHTGF